MSVVASLTGVAMREDEARAEAAEGLDTLFAGGGGGVAAADDVEVEPASVGGGRVGRSTMVRLARRSSSFDWGCGGWVGAGGATLGGGLLDGRWVSEGKVVVRGAAEAGGADTGWEGVVAAGG